MMTKVYLHNKICVDMEYKDVIESLKKCVIIANGRTYKIISVNMTYSVPSTPTVRVGYVTSIEYPYYNTNQNFTITINRGYLNIDSQDYLINQGEVLQLQGNITTSPFR